MLDYVFNAKVYNVVDGDTIDVELDLGFRLSIKQRLRLNGIDTPERGQPGFNEAKEALAKYILNKDVLVTTYKTSKYGYYLADIEFDNQKINNLMVEEGYAKRYFGGTKESWN